MQAIAYMPPGMMHNMENRKKHRRETLCVPEARPYSVSLVFH